MSADFQKLNTELFTTSKKIAEKSNEIESARTEYLGAKDKYERDYSMNLLLTKTKNPEMTQSEIKAESICKVYELKLAMRVKESAYRRLMSELKSLNTLLESLQEISYNSRIEMKNVGKSY